VARRVKTPEVVPVVGPLRVRLFSPLRVTIDDTLPAQASGSRDSVRLVISDPPSIWPSGSRDSVRVTVPVAPKTLAYLEREVASAGDLEAPRDSLVFEAVTGAGERLSRLFPALMVLEESGEIIARVGRDLELALNLSGKVSGGQALLGAHLKLRRDDAKAEPKPRKLPAIIAEALAIEQEDALAADRVVYMARDLVNATLPHKDPKRKIYTRKNGDLELAIVSQEGIPYGRYPRLLLAWLTTEAVKTKDPTLRLGDSLSEFMGQLGLPVTGGPRGAIPMLQKQARRLFTSTISAVYKDDKAGFFEEGGFRVAETTRLWWDPKNPNQFSIGDSFVVLDRRFFESITKAPVPLDMRALMALRSPLAMDLYAWSTYRVSYLRRPVLIPWGMLALQFGSDYKRQRAFKAAVLRSLKQVITVYPALRVSVKDSGLELKPSPTHVAMLPR